MDIGAAECGETSSLRSSASTPSPQAGNIVSLPSRSPAQGHLSGPAAYGRPHRHFQRGATRWHETRLTTRKAHHWLSPPTGQAIVPDGGDQVAGGDEVVGSDPCSPLQRQQEAQHPQHRHLFVDASRTRWQPSRLWPLPHHQGSPTAPSPGDRLARTRPRRRAQTGHQADTETGLAQQPASAAQKLRLGRRRANVPGQTGPAGNFALSAVLSAGVYKSRLYWVNPRCLWYIDGQTTRRSSWGVAGAVCRRRSEVNLLTAGQPVWLASFADLIWHGYDTTPIPHQVNFIKIRQNCASRRFRLSATNSE